ncbi:MAG: HAMP domain-containing sensor histidine kinase, partial [Melioribacteraceae bacterium]
AINGLTELLLEDESLNEEGKEIVEMIGEAGNRQKELITRLLHYSHFEGGDFNLEMSEVNVVYSINKILPNFMLTAENKNQKIQFNYNNEETLISADNLLFSEIIENLLSNAIKYSPPNRNIFIDVLKVRSKVQINIRDEGPGFSEDDKIKMYKPFVKLSAQPTGGELSTGLGLSIVKRLTELNKGTITLVSTQRHGSEFILEFDEVKED